MRDDKLNGHILLSRCLIDQGKLEQANAALNEIRTDVSRNQNPVNRLLFSIADARIQAAGATPSRSSARTQLQRSMREAGNLGLLPLQLEAQLALDEMELSERPAAGKNDLEFLESRAHAHGFELIAQRAAVLRTGHNGWPTSRSR
jgi:hypothetical protein